ncbi:MAG: hypothetical protein ACOCUI_04825 [bacterium]
MQKLFLVILEEDYYIKCYSKSDNLLEELQSSLVNNKWLIVRDVDEQTHFIRIDKIVDVVLQGEVV